MQPITDLIPHRPPFLFVDRLSEAGGDQIVGHKRFDPNEPFFAGHFPGFPVVPGVLLVECMAQCGGAGLAAAREPAPDGDGEPERAFLASVEKAKFRRPVRPGEEVRIVVVTRRRTAVAIRQSGKVYVGEELAAEAEWLCLRGA
jgi:3-hydroxyacyl-[acyl-carrier-protein] dehydratase